MIESCMNGVWRRSHSLCEAIGLVKENENVISVVGAGGKTTVIRRLMKECADKSIPVVVTTTTHIQRLDTAYCLEQPSIESLHQMLEKEGKAWLGSPCTDEKLEAFPQEFLQRVIEMGMERKVPILIEADGARGLPCKAPAGHEPVIPHETTMILSLYGLDAIGQEIGKACLRSEYAARILGKCVHEVLTPDDIVRLASHEFGGKKSMEDSMDYQVILNKADDSIRKTTGVGIAEELMCHGVKKVHLTAQLM